MKTKWVSMLFIAVAVYLTIISVHLHTMSYWSCTVDTHVFINEISSLLQILFPIVAVFLYLTVFGLLYISYRGQFRKITGHQVICIVGLQSFITALMYTGIFVIYWILVFGNQFILASFLENYFLLSPMFFFIPGALLLAGICLIIHHRLGIKR